jgi:hypothetical protein
MHLDGPLSWCAYRAAVEGGDPSALRLPPMREWAHDFVLPLATWTAPCTRPDPDPRLLGADGTSVWGWACSAAHYRVLRHTVAAVRRRPATDEMTYWTTAARHHPGLGPRRAVDARHQAVWVDRVRWYALADPDRLAQLLTLLSHTGRLVRHGWGQVLSISVQPHVDAADRWRLRDWPHPGTSLRSIRAPYHHHSRRMPCRREIG